MPDGHESRAQGAYQSGAVRVSTHQRNKIGVYRTLPRLEFRR